MKNTPFWIIDAFTGNINGRTLRGNPAAVVLLDDFAPDEQLLEWANEFNLSETAFVVSRGGTNFDLRWMTPRTEVALCGHATLATARALLDAGQLVSGQEARFSTQSGLLLAKVEGERINLNFPAQSANDCVIPAALCSALGLNASEILFCGRGDEDWLVRVAPNQLEKIHPDFKKLRQIEARGVIVTAHASITEERYDFASRFFGPRVGIDEDPVTGSAHTLLAPFWATCLGKTQLTAVQLSPRGGLLELKAAGSRVIIGGRTTIRARGHLL